VAVQQSADALLCLGRSRFDREYQPWILPEPILHLRGGILGGLSNYIRTSSSASGYLTLFTFDLNEKQANVVLGVTTSLSAMLPQYSKHYDTGVWDWYDAKEGATRYEMLYIDGMNTGRGFQVIFDQAYLWDNQVSISWPLAQNVLSAELYASATGVSPDLNTIKATDLAWYFSMGAGVKLKVPGFPLGLYLVKNATYIDDAFSWEGGNIFKGTSADSGLSLVLAITTTLY
jgi:outer membrane protein insertion porin family